MSFEITANNLARKSEIKSLKLTSEEYDATFFYMGDYENDRKNGNCDFHNVSLTCKPKGENLPIKLISREVMIDLMNGYILRRQEIDHYKKLLDVAVEAAAELQQLLKEYFDVEAD